MTTAEDRAALVSSESARLLEYFKSLTPADWQTQSACEAWNNADVVAHLIMAVDNFSGNIERGAQGDSSPPEGMPPPQETDMAARMAANATRAVAVRESLGDSLVDAFAQNCERLDTLLAGIGPDDWEKPCYHAAAILTISRYLNLRLTEMVVHEWDIRSRLEPSAKLPDAVTPSVLELLPGFVVGRLFQPGAGIAKAARFRFNLTDEGNLDIVAGGGELGMESSTSDAADVTFTCNASTLALLAYGRFTVAEAVTAGDITIEGDRELAAQF
jgi:uncharacterized protein (TIGR03083 family)